MHKRFEEFKDCGLAFELADDGRHIFVVQKEFQNKTMHFQPGDVIIGLVWGDTLCVARRGDYFADGVTKVDLSEVEDGIFDEDLSAGLMCPECGSSVDVYEDKSVYCADPSCGFTSVLVEK